MPLQISVFAFPSFFAGFGFEPYTIFWPFVSQKFKQCDSAKVFKFCE